MKLGQQGKTGEACIYIYIYRLVSRQNITYDGHCDCTWWLTACIIMPCQLDYRGMCGNIQPNLYYDNPHTHSIYLFSQLHFSIICYKNIEKIDLIKKSDFFGKKSDLFDFFEKIMIYSNPV